MCIEERTVYRSLQQVFDIVWQALVVDGVRRNGTSSFCVYAPIDDDDPKSVGCAVGMLLTQRDAEACDALGYNSIGHPKVWQIVRGYFDTEHDGLTESTWSAFLWELQNAHDEPRPTTPIAEIGQRRWMLIKVAEEWDLRIPETV